MTAATPRDPLTILVVDDEAIVRESLGAWFRDDGYDVRTASSGAEALKAAAERPFDIAMIDVKMPKMDGLELQARLLQADPALTTILMTAYASVDTAVRALKAGAYDYIVKPFDPDELLHVIQRAVEHRTLRSENLKLKQSLEAVAAPVEIVGRAPCMTNVLDLVRTVAPSDTTVLIHGESGTGKELVARAIHLNSPRRYNPLVAVHCGAIAEGILESELFGHEKGAFTGAAYHHKGKFEQADGGTIFLDEVGDISSRVQIELLRVLEEKQVTRVGGKRAIPVDFRVVAATHRDLAAMVAEGEFREDLFYRLNVITLELPPLRDRREDIVPLAEHFLARFCRSMNRKEMSFAPEALDVLRAHGWPGNVRELQNAVERAVVLGTPPTIFAEDLPRRVDGGAGGGRAGSLALADVERAHIARVLEQTDWNITRAAALLGVDRGTLYHKLHRFGIERPVGHGG